LGFRAHMRSDQDAQPRAVDVLDVVHIQDDLLSFNMNPSPTDLACSNISLVSWIEKKRMGISGWSCLISLAASKTSEHGQADIKKN
jgi:hypothetical protein